MKIIKLNTPINKSFGIYSAIRSIELPDGTSFIPDRCLTDKDLTEAKTVINERTEMITDILDLPEVGEPVAKDVVYKITEGEGILSETKLVICQQPHNRTEHDVTTIPNLFTFFRTNSDDLEWIPNEKVDTGWKRMYNGVQYEQIQPSAILTVVGQTPDLTPALWKKAQTDEVQEWVQPTGGHDAYNIGDRVLFNGAIYESVINANVWSPTGYAAGWKKI